MPYVKTSPNNKMSSEKMPVNSSKKGTEEKKAIRNVTKETRKTAKVS